MAASTPITPLRAKSPVATSRVAAIRDSRWLGYVVALVMVALAIALTIAGRSVFSRTVFILAFAAVALTAWLAGFRPALFATVLSVLGVDYYVAEPIHSLEIDQPSDLVPLAAFIGVSLLINWLTEEQRRAVRVAADHARTIEEQAASLQEQSIELEMQLEAQAETQEHLRGANSTLEEANAALERNREFLEQAQRAAQIGSWELDIASSRVTWSDELYRMYEIEPGTPVTFDMFVNLVHPEDREHLRSVVRRALDTGEPFRVEHRALLVDDSVRWVLATGRVIIDDNGDAVSLRGSRQDITELRRANESQRMLAEASAILANSLDYRDTLKSIADLAVGSIADWCSVALGDETGQHATIAVAHKDPERVRWAEAFTRANPPRFDSPTGVPNVLRTGVSELYSEINSELLERAAATPQERAVIAELNMQSAIVVPMTARGRRIGAITFVSAESKHRFNREDLWFAERMASRAAMAIDNARLYEEAQLAREEAERANRAKMDFLAAMSHELRTPLNAIAGYTQILEMGIHGPVSDKQREQLQRLQRSQRHLLKLVEEVLSFARLEVGRVEFATREVPIAPLLTEVGHMVASQAEAKSVHFSQRDGNPDLVANADPERLEQILLNLLGNAVKFTPEGGRVTVVANQEGDSVHIVVEDSGVGIPESELEKVFEPFVQLQQPREKRASGLGLGLAISRELARGMGGDITVESTVGKGSRFTVSLPRG